MDDIEDVLNHLQDRVFKTSYRDKDCYVKLLSKPKRNKFHTLQSMIYRMTRIPLFAPTFIAKGGNSIVYEMRKIRKLQQLGLSVPQIYACSDHYLIMEDCGKSLSKIIKADPNQTQKYLEMAIAELAKMHRMHQCHGGSQIRNFTFREGRIYLIDFEEEVKPEFFNGIAFRDIILFMMSIFAEGIFNFSLQGLITVYEKESNINIREHLIHIAKKFYFLEVLTKKPFVRWCGKDLWVANRLFEQIRFLESS
jgi:hypothetical protein